LPTHQFAVAIESLILNINFLFLRDVSLTNNIQQFLPFLRLLLNFQIIILNKPQLLP
jgi:hypothetical protein